MTGWSFGIKPVVRPKNLDIPGVGNVEVDMAAMWTKNPSYWIGTDVRKPFCPHQEKKLRTSVRSPWRVRREMS